METQHYDRLAISRCILKTTMLCGCHDGYMLSPSPHSSKTFVILGRNYISCCIQLLMLPKCRRLSIAQILQRCSEAWMRSSTFGSLVQICTSPWGYQIRMKQIMWCFSYTTDGTTKLWKPRLPLSVTSSPRNSRSENMSVSSGYSWTRHWYNNTLRFWPM